MQDLRARLINGGFPEVEFRILNTKSATNETEGFGQLRYAAGHPEIPVLQEMTNNSLWYELLDGALDNILVLDRCSRLTYQVIMPWSILHFPYVKAAILSTYEDDPCGPCAVSVADLINLEQNSSNIDDLSSISNSTPQFNENGIHSISGSTTSNYEAVDIASSVEFPYYSSSEQTHSSTVPDINADVEVYERDKSYELNVEENIIDDTPLSDKMRATLAPLVERSDGTVPIRVVMHAPHLHRHNNGSITKHEYLELQTGNPDYHGHLTNDNMLHSNRSEEQAQNLSKLKSGQRRKGKLRPETIQAEPQEDNYEDTKLKHHRHKGRPVKKKQKLKSNGKGISEEEAAPPSPEHTSGLPLLSHTEPASLEIPQDIQEHYDYRNMPYFSSKHLHKPLRVTEATTVLNRGDTESSFNADGQVHIEDAMNNQTKSENRDSEDIVLKAITSDKQLIKTSEKMKDHKKWKSNHGYFPQQKGNLENERVVLESQAADNTFLISNGIESSNSDSQHHPQGAENTFFISNSTESSNSDQQQQSQDYDTARYSQTFEADPDLNMIDTEEDRTNKPDEAENEMKGNENKENRPTVELSNEDDDESKKQIIQHYSQLLKWIHYRLPETGN